MSKLRLGAYASIVTGSVVIVCAAAGIISGPAEMEIRVETPEIAEAIPAPVATEPAAETALIESSEIAAGFRAYQDEDGNFVAPPTGTQLPAAASQQPVGAPVIWQNAIPGGGIAADASGFRMSQHAIVTEDGEIGVVCNPLQGHHAGHDHGEEEH